MKCCLNFQVLIYIMYSFKKHCYMLSQLWLYEITAPWNWYTDTYLVIQPRSPTLFSPTSLLKQSTGLPLIYNHSMWAVYIHEVCSALFGLFTWRHFRFSLERVLRNFPYLFNHCCSNCLVRKRKKYQGEWAKAIFHVFVIIW